MFVVLFVVFLVCAWFIQESARNSPPKNGPEQTAPITLSTRLKALLNAVPLVAVLAFAVSLVVSCSNQSTDAKSAATSEISFAEALTKCQYALKNASKDPETAEVPFVESSGDGREYYFAWGASTKPVRMKNSYGALLSAGASCVVDRASGRITSATLDSKSIM